jgi:hypothetical protein
MAKTEAEKWLNKIDYPAKATPSGISRDAVELMQGHAVDVLQGAVGATPMSLSSKTAAGYMRSARMIGILWTQKR